MDKIKVVIADEQVTSRQLLRSVLNKDESIEILGEVCDGLELIKFCDENALDMIITDIELLSLSGLDASKRIKMKYPDIKILVLTTLDSEEYIKQSLAVATDGYLLKGCEEISLLWAIKSVESGMNTVDRLVQKKMSEIISNYEEQSASAKELTSTELRVMKLVAEGEYNKDIATHLGISYGRTRNIVSCIYKKTGAKSRKEITGMYG